MDPVECMRTVVADLHAVRGGQQQRAGVDVAGD